MSFKRSVSPTFKAEVTCKVPDEAGNYTTNTFTATFARPKTSEVPALRNLSDEDLVRKQATGWDLKDADSNDDVPFNKAELETVLQIQPSPRAIALAFWEQLNGARAKN